MKLVNVLQYYLEKASDKEDASGGNLSKLEEIGITKQLEAVEKSIDVVVEYIDAEKHDEAKGVLMQMAQAVESLKDDVRKALKE